MSSNSGFDLLRFRDGASQQDRTAKALDPDYFALDERSLQDLLTFALQYAKTLIYYNRDNEDTGDDWSAFLTGIPKDDEPNDRVFRDGELNEIVAYLKNPSYFDHDPGKKARFSRPHFALFLTFLGLLQEAQVQMNDLTRRQLDFYYQQALGLQRKPDQPDRVHVLAQLEPEVDQILIPKGTILSAGEDDDGDPIIYQTEEEILANQARIRQVKSLFLDKEFNTLFSIREFEKETGDPVRVLVDLLSIVYRQPGTENTPRNYPDNKPTDREMNRTLIDHLDRLHQFIRDELHLRPTAFQHLIELYKAWENPLNWHREGKDLINTDDQGKLTFSKGGGINDYLAKAASRKEKTQFDLNTFKDSRDFNQNLKKALGVDIKGNPASGPNIFEGRLEGVDDFYTLYKELTDWFRLPAEERNPLIKQTINEIIIPLGFDPIDDSENTISFESMMKIRMDTLGYLQEIIRILTEAMRQASKDPGIINISDFYKKDNTLAGIFIEVCKLKNGLVVPASTVPAPALPDPAAPKPTVLEFAGWDKERLTISSKSVPFDIDKLIEKDGGQLIAGGFILERLGDGTIGVLPEKPLEEKKSTTAPAHQPGSFLQFSYNGESENPQVKVILNENAPEDIKIEPETTPGILKITLKNERTRIKDILAKWSSRTSHGGFALLHITPSLEIVDQESTVQLNREWVVRRPAGRTTDYLEVRYAGPSMLTPTLTIIVDEFLDSPAAFELPREEALIIKMRNDRTPAGIIREAWKKNTRKGDFFLEVVGADSTGIDRSGLLNPTVFKSSGKYYSLLADGAPERHFKVQFDDAPGQGRIDPKLKIVLDEGAPEAPLSILFAPSNPDKELTITFNKKNVPVQDILDAWDPLPNANKGRFILEYLPELAIPVSEGKPVKEFSYLLNKEFSFLFPGNDLRVRYRGLCRSPKVAVVTDGNLPPNEVKVATAYQSFSDEYFKIQAEQLAQLERYFLMQAEEFFSIRTLFFKPLGRDWPYKDPAWKWRQVDRLLEAAHRKLFGPDAIPEIARWKNIYISEDAGQVLVPAFDEEEEFPRWKTFGKKPNPDIPLDNEVLSIGHLGFILTSSALSLSEGVRTLTLTLTFDERTFNRSRLHDFFHKILLDPNKFIEREDIIASNEFIESTEFYPFNIEVSTEKEWVAIPKWKRFQLGPKGTAFMEITLLLTEEIEPLAPVQGGALPSPWPALKLSLNKDEIEAFLGGSSEVTDRRRPYELLSELLLTEVKLDVKVEKLTNLLVQTPLGNVDPTAPFEPFGLEPRTGDSFFITHPELAAQRLDSLTLNLNWRNFSAGKLAEHYAPYDHPLLKTNFGLDPITDDSFEVEIVLREAHRKLPLLHDPKDLTDATRREQKHPLFAFNALTAPEYNGLLAWEAAQDPDKPETFSPNQAPYLRRPDPEIIEDDIRRSTRYLQVKLAGQDFLHERYIGMLTWLGLSGAGKLIEEEGLTVTDGAIQFQGVPLKGLQPRDFSITASNATITVEQDGYDEVNKKLKVAQPPCVFELPKDAAGNFLKITYTGPSVAPSVIIEETTSAGKKVGFKTPIEPGKLVIQIPSPDVEDASTAFNEETLTTIFDKIDTKQGFSIERMPDGAAEVKLSPGEFIPNLVELKVTYHGPFVLPEPYTPVLEGISANYTASVQIKLPVEDRIRFAEDLPIAKAEPFVREDEALDHLLHLHPFGFSRVEKNGEWMKLAEELVDEDLMIRERFSFPFIPRYENEGELYLGIENLNPPQTLTMLFQMAEGSSNPDLPTAKVQWSYLAGHNWIDLPATRIRRDTTNGLQKSGILQLDIPAQASLDHFRMPHGLHWLRAGVERFSGSLSDTIAIHSQAVRAVWIDQGLDAAHLSRALPPETIVDPVEPIPGLLNFLQPYSSFGGKQKEKAPAFYRRVSERLRHNNRALTMWDFERLVLEQFPDIYKAKALAADLLDPGAAPGSVTVIVIPDIRYRRPFDPFEPKVPQGRLKEIQDFLQGLAPTFARVQVRNPSFDYLHVRAPVSFIDMNNFGFYAGQLKRELKQYLSPWAFEESAEVVFGKEIYLSMVVHFIETRPYVDFVDQPKLILMERSASTGSIHPIEGGTTIGVDGNVRLRGPDVILVSAPDHTIDFLDTSIPPGERILSGIGYAKLDLDFVVAEDTPEETIP